MTPTVIPEDHEEFSLLDLMVVVAEGARLILGGSLIATVGAYIIALTLPVTFTATTRLLPPQQQSTAAALIGSQLSALAGLGPGSGLVGRNPADLYVGMLKSTSVADALVERFHLTGIYDVKLKEDARKELAERTDVRVGKEGLISVSVDAVNPKLASDLANGYVEELTSLSGRLAVTEAQRRRLFFEQQMKQTEAKLRAAEMALRDSGTGAALLKSVPQAIVEAMARLKAQITAQEVKLATMRSYLTEQSPEFKIAEGELRSLRSQLAQSEADRPNTKGSHQEDYVNRFREFKYQETLYELFVRQYETARIDEAREGAVIQVVDAAAPPERRSRPKRVLISVAAGVVTFFALIAFSVARALVLSTSSDHEASNKLLRIRGGIRRLMGRAGDKVASRKT